MNKTAKTAVTSKKQGFFPFLASRINSLELQILQSSPFLAKQIETMHWLVVFVICVKMKSQRIVYYTVILLLRFKNLFPHYFIKFSYYIRFNLEKAAQSNIVNCHHQKKFCNFWQFLADLGV